MTMRSARALSGILLSTSTPGGPASGRLLKMGGSQEIAQATGFGHTMTGSTSATACCVERAAQVPGIRLHLNVVVGVARHAHLERRTGDRLQVQAVAVIASLHRCGG